MNNVPEHIAAVACNVLCGLPGETASYMTDAAHENLLVNDVEPAYKVWHQWLAAQFVAPAES